MVYVRDYFKTVNLLSRPTDTFIDIFDDVRLSKNIGHGNDDYSSFLDPITINKFHRSKFIICPQFKQSYDLSMKIYDPLILSKYIDFISYQVGFTFENIPVGKWNEKFFGDKKEDSIYAKVRYRN
jgi:hypothetical protein